MPIVTTTPGQSDGAPRPVVRKKTTSSAAAKTASAGLCSLVGAGPGDPGLLTLRAKERIQQADVIVHDALASPAILRWARADALLINAGKRAGHHTLKQEETNALLLQHTRAGKRVVRLKGGDPMIFGRGGEEAQELADAGLPYEIIPGVTSAIAGPAYAGIPATHRAHGSALTILTGHEDPTKGATSIDYAHLARTPGAKIILMAVERLPGITSALVAHGADPATPCAIVQWATTPRQRTVTGPLSDIARIAADSGIGAPAVTIIGHVATLRPHINWFETRPLFGKRIVVTRARQQAGRLAEALEELGADIIEIPTIRIAPPADLLALGEAVRDTHTYDWLVLTSPNGAEAYFRTYDKLYRDARDIGNVRIAAIGPATAQTIRDRRLQVDLVPEEHTSAAITAALRAQGDIDNLKILIVRGEKADDTLPRELEKHQAIVDTAIAYRTLPEDGDPTGGAARYRDEGADLLTFTSASTVENFLALGLPMPPGVLIASIGPLTTAALESAGLTAHIQAKTHDLPGLVTAIRAHYGV